jgi:hypothetical protein
MAHKIEQHDKQQGLKQAWHGLTEICPEITLENNWLNQWEITPRELFFEATLDKQKVGAVTKSVIKQDKAGFSVLSVSDVPGLLIGSAYNPETFKPIDNKAFLELVRASIAGTGHKIVTVGSVRNRGRVFLSVELKGMEKFSAAGREFSAFLNFGNGHDKSSVLWVNTSNICTVCDNTFGFNLHKVENKAMDNADDISIRQRHTKNAELKLPGIAALVDKAIGAQGEFAIALNSLAAQPIAEKNALNLFAGFLGRKVTDIDKGLSTRAENTANRLLELHKAGLGNRGENLADSFQAVTEYYTRESSGGENRAKQIVSSEFGSGAVAKAEFWNIVRDDGKREATIERGEKLLVASVN